MKENIEVTKLEIIVWLVNSSQPIIHKDSTAYQKGSFYCVYDLDANIVFKYPVDHIWRISESYPQSLRRG